MKTRHIYLILLGVFSISTYFIGSEMKKLVPSKEVIAFEFLWTRDNAQTLLSQSRWNHPDASGSTQKERLTANTYLDFLYILSYTGLFLILTRTLLGKNPSQIGLLYKAFMVAALVDIIENICLLQVLKENYSIFATIMSLSATIKFGLLFTGLGTLIIVLVKTTLKYR